MRVIYTQSLVSKGRPLCPEVNAPLPLPLQDWNGLPSLDSEGLSVLVKVQLPDLATITCTEPPATKVCTGQGDFSRWDSTSEAHCTRAQGSVLIPSMWPGGVKVLLFIHKPLNVWGCSYPRTQVARICLLVMGLYNTVRLTPVL